MNSIHQSTALKNPVQKTPEIKLNKHLQVIEKTYFNNIESDYTEKIEALGKGFNYDDNSDYYWGPPEFSLLYGTPLYQQASPSQKLALNHLYWVGQYNHTATAEANTMLYNQVTAGVFSTLNGYDTLCKELEFETSQERYHTQTFQRVGYKTKIALMGKAALGNPLSNKSQAWMPQNGLKKSLPKFLQQYLNLQKIQGSLETWQDTSFRAINRIFLKGHAAHYSEYLKQQDSIPTTHVGLARITAPPAVFKFLTLSWGSSPFLAAQYYSARMIANVSLKAYEYHYYKQFRTLEKNGDFVPTPTAISYYHLLDESFHTTLSQVISQQLYKDFAQPSAYEQLLANTITYLAQRNILGGISGGIPATFRHDKDFMLSFYRILKSRIFNLSETEILYWMERCLCQEHDGWHTNLKHHQKLLTEFQRFFGKLDYLWVVNREMKLMATGASIPHAIQSNCKAFKQFTQSVEEGNKP
jgi:hypothetical protein